jgi:RimJ/RimL family protein N-acetyltransferase
MSGEHDLGVSIVPITEEHIGEYHRAVDLVAREGKYLGRTEAPPLEDARTFTRENIARGNAHFVAVDGGRVVGWCDIVPSKREAFVHCGTLGMGLLAEYRGRGLGLRLLRAALDKAQQNGLERVELEVFEPNERAIRLYRNAGFVVEGTKVRGARLRGECYNVVCMTLFLHPGPDRSEPREPGGGPG